jgi:hypothetical protein
MTIEEFNQTGFGPRMFATYRGGVYPISAVAFDEALLALEGVVEDAEHPSWVRCEHVEIVPKDKEE